jgi:hypothetical protein
VAGDGAVECHVDQTTAGNVRGASATRTLVCKPTRNGDPDGSGRKTLTQGGVHVLKTRCFLLAACAAVIVSPAVADDAARQAQREKKFAEALSGAVLVGQFSIDGVQTDKLPFPERYELKSVKKAKDGLWTFTAHVTFLKQDKTIPVTVPVVWAGDTPMISLTDAELPGMGKELSAKVIFDGGRYAGTWQHGKFGGHMWGKIERPGTSKPESGGDQAGPAAKPPARE